MQLLRNFFSEAFSPGLGIEGAELFLELLSGIAKFHNGTGTKFIR